MNTNRIITTREASERLHVSENALREMRRSGIGPKYVLFGNRPLYPKETLKQFLLGRVRDERGDRSLL